MWIGNALFISLVMILSVQGCGKKSVANQSKPLKTNYAWWLTEEVKLEEHTTRRLLDIDDFKSVGGASSDINNSKLRFTVFSDLNKDGIKEKYQSGVYEESGESGTFVIVTQKDEELIILKRKGEKLFNALLVDNGRVFWFDCMECDNFEEIRWSTKSGYYLW